MKSPRHPLIRQHPIDAEGHMNTADRLIHKHEANEKLVCIPANLSRSSYNCAGTKLLKAFSGTVLFLQVQNGICKQAAD